MAIFEFTTTEDGDRVTLALSGERPAIPRIDVEVTAAANGLDAATLDELLGEADFVTLHTDLNPTSYHLMTGERLRRMKRTAYLINVGRGVIVDLADLTAALDTPTITRLNARVDVDGEPADKVARDFLVERRIIPDGG
jgi:phosphoglycerate dehydrogenase-like enzyme